MNETHVKTRKMAGKRKHGRSEKFHGGRGVNSLGRGAYLSAYYKFITCVLFLCLSVLFTDKKGSCYLEEYK